ncbi:T9SS type A sorting domain-containing protein [Flavobacterium eburneipallidum]|uniref:T9SS type A sorting domain-containing protein n=1 Tax=Flavobacterium eburneipallidum TaxID=3003263 RepID=UPI002482A568|nr:T9SS type A sorting domain-containing protein [Flavobacterium eburneipallidum]
MTKLLLKNKLTTALSLMLFATFVPMQSIAQAKKVAYIQFSKAMDATASQTGNATATGSDAITRMLTDTGFDVTVYACDANGKNLATNVSVDTEITGADLIIMQETWGSTAAAIKPTGVLAIRKLSLLNIPVIYNKSFAFQKVNTRAITSVTGTTYDVTSASSLSGQVVSGKESNPIFNGITGTSIPFFNAGATDTGQLGIATSVKALSLVNDLEIGALGTLLAGTSGSVAAGTPIATTSNDTSLFINHIPAGTQIGTDPLDKLATKDMILFALNYGAIAAGNGSNITNELLTVWRNAAHILTGRTVPTTLYQKPLSIKENTLADNSVSVSPNPTKGLVTVTSTSAVKAVTVFDTTGKQVSASKTNTVDLSSQAKGVYLVNVKTENGSTTKKVVVE